MNAAEFQFTGLIGYTHPGGVQGPAALLRRAGFDVHDYVGIHPKQGVDILSGAGIELFSVVDQSAFAAADGTPPWLSTYTRTRRPWVLEFKADDAVAAHRLMSQRLPDVMPLGHPVGDDPWYQQVPLFAVEHPPLGAVVCIGSHPDRTVADVRRDMVQREPNGTDRIIGVDFVAPQAEAFARAWSKLFDQPPTTIQGGWSMDIGLHEFRWFEGENDATEPFQTIRALRFRSRDLALTDRSLREAGFRGGTRPSAYICDLTDLDFVIEEHDRTN